MNNEIFIVLKRGTILALFGEIQEVMFHPCNKKRLAGFN
jgi:hypothetical protein